MSPRTTPPFRADHVGSLLRPPALLKAREDFKAGRIDADELRGIEDEAIRDVVRKQEEVGLQSATDGEFRRASWHMDFIYQLGGDHHGAGPHHRSSSATPRGRSSSRRRRCTSRSAVALREPIFADAFTFVQDVVTHGDAEADDPLAEHGPLPRRARGGQRGRLPRHGRLLERPHERLRRRGQGAGRPRLHLPAVRRHEPRLPQRPQAARARSPRSGATPSTSTRPTSATSTRRSRAAPRT